MINVMQGGWSGLKVNLYLVFIFVPFVHNLGRKMERFFDSLSSSQVSIW